MAASAWSASRKTESHLHSLFSQEEIVARNTVGSAIFYALSTSLQLEVCKLFVDTSSVPFVLHCFRGYRNSCGAMRITKNRSAPNEEPAPSFRNKSDQSCCDVNEIFKHKGLYGILKSVLFDPNGGARFDMHVWPNLHGWFDSSSNNLENTIVHDIKELSISVNIYGSDGLAAWLKKRLSKRFWSAFFPAMSSLRRLNICVIQWPEYNYLDDQIVAKQVHQMKQASDLFYWLMARLGSDVEITGVTPDHFMRFYKSDSDLEAYLAPEAIEALVHQHDNIRGKALQLKIGQSIDDDEPNFFSQHRSKAQQYRIRARQRSKVKRKKEEAAKEMRAADFNRISLPCEQSVSPAAPFPFGERAS